MVAANVEREGQQGLRLQGAEGDHACGRKPGRLEEERPPLALLASPRALAPEAATPPVVGVGLRQQQ